jgi:hypothetical protein
MNSIWQEFLRASGARIDQDLVTDFGDAPRRTGRSRDATIVSPLTHLGLIEVGGPEARSLSAQSTDQRRQAPGRDAGAAFGLVLGQGQHAGQLSRLPQRTRLSSCNCPPTCCRRSTSACRCSSCAAR